MGSAKNSPRCLPIYPEICSHSYFLLSVPFWNSSRGVGSLPFLYWITVVYMNYTGPYGNLFQFVRGKTSSQPTQFKEIQVREKAYRYQCSHLCVHRDQWTKFCQYIKVTSRNYRQWCFKDKRSPAHAHISIYSVLQLLSPPYTKLASCLHATSSSPQKNQRLRCIIQHAGRLWHKENYCTEGKTVPV